MTKDQMITAMRSLLEKAKKEGYVFSFESRYDDRIREWITVTLTKKNLSLEYLIKKEDR